MKFPGLISGCTINWFSHWPKDALCAVSEHFLADYKVECSPQVKRELIRVVADVHDDADHICDDYFNR